MWRLYLLIAVLIAVTAWFIVRQIRRNTRSAIHDEHWVHYMCQIDDRSASVLVNIAAKKLAPDAGRPWIHFIKLNLQDQRENGLPSSAESEALMVLDDRLTEELRRAAHAVHVANITTAGRRELYFYSPTKENLSPVVADVFDEFPSYAYELHSWKDAEWDAYLGDLYPNDFAWQWINDMAVVEALKEDGDDPSIPRLIEHWAYFKSKPDRNRFSDTISEQGFGSMEMLDDDDADLPFGIRFARTDAADIHSINWTTCKLLQLAQECNGEYDGWETQVASAEE